MASTNFQNNRNNGAVVDTERATAGQIRRAAGGKDLAKLQNLVETGWTVQEINDMASKDGKNAVHMAAWQGTIENLQYLLDLGCDMNVVATGEFSYGKTPIFFATTQSRNDVVTYLLDNGAAVKLVNNKGQSVLSIASSHLDPEVVGRIQDAERQQATVPWRNYRETHSDGLEYGDLDPRFLERPLRETDVVTELAVNPTTRESRRGSFLRRNPNSKLRTDRRNKRSRGRSKRRAPVIQLSEEEQQEKNRIWVQLERGLKECSADGIFPALVRLVELCDKERGSWIPDAAYRIRRAASDVRWFRHVMHQDMTQLGKVDTKVAMRSHNLLRKLELELIGLRKDQSRQGMGGTTDTSDIFGHDDIDHANSGGIEHGDHPYLSSHHFLGGGTSSSGSSSNNNSNIGTANTNSHGGRKQQRHRPRRSISFSDKEWQRANEEVQDLSFDILENPHRNGTILTLPDEPTWVDSVEKLKELQTTIGPKGLVALDTEWYDKPDGSTGIATLQCAITTDECSIQAWVIDMLDEDLRPDVCEFIQTLFSGNYQLLGFAFHHDIEPLEEYIHPHQLIYNDNTDVLDIQQLAAHSVFWKAPQPGLQSCCAVFSKYSLSKKEQCSRWGTRPLSQSQLEYAGLDAGCLLVLLARLYKERFDSTVATVES